MSTQGHGRVSWRQGFLRDLAVVALLLGLCLFFFWRIITPNAEERGSLRQGDFYNQFYAFAAFEYDQLSRGELPLWNPYTFSGHPFLADIQSAVFYPLSLLTMLASLIWGFSAFALELEAIAHFFLAGVFTYFFARRLLQNRAGALVSAVTFTFGGYLTSYPILQLAVLETAIWLPLILLFLDLAIAPGQSHPLWACGQRRLAILYLLLAGLTLGVAILAGHPQTAMYVLYLSALYYAFKVWRVRKDRAALAYADTAFASWWFVLGGFALFVVSGLGLAAAQLVPSLEYMQLSSRPELGYQDLSGGFAYLDLVQVLLPHATGFWSPLYIGIFPLLLSLFAIYLLLRGEVPSETRRQHQWWRVEIAFWAIVAGVAFLLSVGDDSFVYSLFYLYVPGFGLFRGQERAALLFSLSLSLLAGYGFAALLVRAKDLQKLGQDSRALFRLVVGLALGVAALLILLYFGGSVGVMDSMLDLGRYVAVLLAASLLWLLVWRWRRGPWLLGTALALALVLFDLVTVNSHVNVQERKIENQVRATGVIRELQAQPGMFRVHNEFRLPGNHGIIFGLEDTWGASPLRLASYERLFETLPLERAWELLNVGYVVTWLDDIDAPSSLVYQEPARRGEVDYVHRLDGEHPRAWTVYQAEVLPGEDQVLDRLGQPDFDPYAVALVTEPLVSPLAGTQAGTPQVKVVAFSPSRLAVEVEQANNGLLVLSENSYPGWQASVDGRQVPMVLANATLRAVEVPAGQHRVEMSFRPPSVRLGMVVSVLTLLASLFFGLWCVATCIRKPHNG